MPSKVRQGTSATLGVALQLFPDPQGFRAIIDQRFLEPGMLKSFLGCDAAFWVINKDAL
ncbi:hypothetical protein EYZ11_010439 [Aspergillus tanneri]|uniref:Uncharacterized protein n=1 Tax=Aspergillus tanneri TaxID=1220188 RepID=A0A4S3J7I3_9EURO|nr:hypothetical protein EYZ11_010439 [Aspergillus tanneri]